METHANVSVYQYQCCTYDWTYKQGVPIKLNPSDHTESFVFQYIYVYVSHHLCINPMVVTHHLCINPMVVRPGTSTFPMMHCVFWPHQWWR